MSFTQHTQRIGPARGLIVTKNRRGASYRPESIRRWFQLNRVVFKAEKVDILLGEVSTETCLGYLAEAAQWDLRVSLRSTCASPPPELATLSEAGLLDVFLTPDSMEDTGLDQWLTAAHEAHLPVRLQIPLRYPSDFNPGESAQHLAQQGVKVVNLSAHDAFQTAGAIEASVLDLTRDFIEALEAYSIEVNVMHLPFCQVEESLWPYLVNDPQLFNGHQHYSEASYTLAQQLAEKGPIGAAIVLQILQRRYVFMDDPIDRILLPWLLEKPWLRARVIAWHRLTRNFRRGVPKPLAVESESSADHALEEKATTLEKDLGRICSVCRFRLVCNHDTHPGSKALINQACVTLSGKVVADPLYYLAQRRIYCDAIDGARYTLPERMEALATTARTLVETTSPTREIDSLHYATEGQWCHQLPGGVRWYGFTRSEKRSTPLGTFPRPFTLSYVVGGGIAEYAGFSLGRQCTLVCPMESFQHTFTLHVAENGDYVLLRDGIAMHPVQFEGGGSVPLRLGTPLTPRIVLRNIDQSLVTQNVNVWCGDAPLIEPPRPVAYSIVTVCVRYARRLQVMLQSIAHQAGIDLAEVEVIVAYVPDVDATEDVLDSIEVAHPALSIRRVALSESKAKAKGFIINECIEVAQGDRVMLLDADSVLPPDFIQQLNAYDADTAFIVPDGRKLLSPDITAQVLLGDLKPWEDWDALLASEGEMRHREMDGVPIGFCQVVRRDCFKQVQYYEADHFEGADWQFSIEMRKVFGEEIRLSGTPLLHLDHGGSKWYGTTRQY